MTHFLRLALLALMLALPRQARAAAGAATSPAPPLNDATAGQALAADLRNARPSAGAEFRGSFKLRHSDGSISNVPVVSRIVLNDKSWQAEYVASQTNWTEMLVVLHLDGQPNHYRHAVGLTNALSPCDQPWQPFAGTDFLLADLGLEFFHWPSQVLVRHEMRKSRACHVLESRPAVTNAYARVLSWVDVETGGLLRAEAYDAKNERVKVFEVLSFKKAGDQYQLQEMQILDLKRRSRTLLEFEVPEK